MILKKIENGEIPNIKKINNSIATKNLCPGVRVYGEREIRGFRVWNPKRSKLSAAIFKGLKEFPFKRDSKVLYLGAASGTTSSHISDIVDSGIVYCVEFSPRVFSKLLEVCKKRKNMVPILEDARFPERYEPFIDVVDVIYQDIAQPDQVDIAKRNADYFLRKGGYLFLALKARSIDVSKSPKKVLKNEIKKLKREFNLLEKISLEPYHKDHFMIVAHYV